jgi:hypothetical protein
MKPLRGLKLLFILLFSINCLSQDFSSLWEGHFSYLNIKDIAQGNNKIYAAAENAIFTYDLATEEIEKLSTINGLSGETISTMHYSEAFGLLLVGYDNGLIDIVFETNQDVLAVVDIIEKETIPPNNKRINHFNEYDSLIYISTDFGISVFDLERLEFGDTYYIGTLGAQKKIAQTTIFNDVIYSASETGIQKAFVNNNNLIDYSEWTTVGVGNWVGIESLEGKLYAARSDRRVFEIINDVFTLLLQYGSRIVDMRSVEGQLVITTLDTVYTYDSSFVLLNSTAPVNFNTSLTCGTSISENSIFIGTRDFGVLTPNIETETGFEEIRPDGPLLNNIFSLETTQDNLWAVFGGYNVNFVFSGPNPRPGISHFNDGEWTNISYEEIASVVSEPRFLSHVTINPLNPDQVFISSYFSGLIEVIDNEVIGIYNQDNSTLLPFVADLYLTLDGKYDQNNALWVLNARVDRALNKFDNGQWTSYSFGDLISDPLEELGFPSLAIDRSGTKFIGSYALGVIGYNENGNLIKTIQRGDLEGNLPGNYIAALAMDNSNRLWIGTNKGLRVLNNTADFFTNENVSANEIIILEEGVPKELLFQQFITDIEVDGSNNKWIGTLTAGLFYFSSDGQETIFHFTKDNSPLPSNSINDVTIDQGNGRVYIATDKGLVSFDSGGSTPKEGLTEAFIYPNPVRPTFNIIDEKVKIKDISDNVNIKIVDIEGNLVAEAQSRTNSRYKGYNLEVDGGTAYWNGKNLANNIVSSGVYLVMLSDLDTFETKVLKLMVVR